jgi:hypothetical protein
MRDRLLLLKINMQWLRMKNSSYLRNYNLMKWFSFHIKLKKRHLMAYYRDMIKLSRILIKLCKNPNKESNLLMIKVNISKKIKKLFKVLQIEIKMIEIHFQCPHQEQVRKKWAFQKNLLNISKTLNFKHRHINLLYKIFHNFKV